MKPDYFKEAGIIWRRLANGATEEELKFELEIYKGLLNFFMVGDYYYYIFNVQDAVFDFVSADISHVLGYDIEEIDIPIMVDKIHPEDQPWFLSFENKIMEFFSTLSHDQVPNYKVRYDYRLRKKNGEYIRVLQQVVTIQHIDNRVLRTFGVHTDISQLKQSGSPVLSFIGLNGEPSYLDIDVKKTAVSKISGLTRREHEILYLLADGKSSEEIGQTFSISKQTVDTHRKNLLKKTGCINTAALRRQTNISNRTR